MKNFWQQFKKPIYALAPMAGITDSSFRQVCKKFGADLVYSEMASVTALVYNPKKTLEILTSEKKESPYIIQLFGSDPRHFSYAVKLLTNEKTASKCKVKKYRIPDGFDINFGCPVKKVQKQGAGAVLMNDLKKSKEIIKEVLDSTDLPVSIKCRSQVGDIDILKFLDNLRNLNISAVMIHGRTLSQGHSGEVNREIIKAAGNYFGGKILANGGIYSREDAELLFSETKADGIGIGQGAMGKPWIFKQLTINNYELSIKEIFKIILEHAKLVEKLKGEAGIIEMRKHLCWYAKGFDGASELRQKFTQVKSYKEIEKILKEFKNI